MFFTFVSEHFSDSDQLLLRLYAIFIYDIIINLRIPLTFWQEVALRDCLSIVMNTYSKPLVPCSSRSTRHHNPIATSITLNELRTVCCIGNVRVGRTLYILLTLYCNIRGKPNESHVRRNRLLTIIFRRHAK